MTDPDLIAKKLAFIEACVTELRKHSRPELIEKDVKEERFIAHTLQIAIQAALDVASHIVSDERLEEPRTNRELFDLLAQDGWINPDQRQILQNMVGFRNIVVHGYEKVDLKILRDIVENHLEDLLNFSHAIRSRINKQQ